MFSIRLFGYDRTEVEKKVQEMQAQIEDLLESLDESETKANHLQAQLEDCSIRLSAARRDRIQALSLSSTHQDALVIFIGPVPSFASLVPLVDDLERNAGLSIKFRVFRDGIYRVDAWVEDIDALVEWLKQYPRVRTVHREEDSVHVVIDE